MHAVSKTAIVRCGTCVSIINTRSRLACCMVDSFVTWLVGWLIRVFAIYLIMLGWIGLENTLLLCINIICKTNERHHNPRLNPNHANSEENSQNINTTYMKTNERHNPRPQPNPRKFREKSGQKYDDGRFLSIFFWVGLALGCKVRWFSYNIYMFSNPA